MNPTAASAAVYSLVAIVLLAGLVSLIPELLRSHFRLRLLELRLTSGSPEMLAAAAAGFLLASSPRYWLRWWQRGRPPLSAIPAPAEIDSLLASL